MEHDSSTITDLLFSCRNCVHNAAQTVNLGPGIGFCLQHNSIVRHPETTTCKYLHRKDLPQFVVDDGVRQHAAEFAFYPRLVSLATGKPVSIQPHHYSERVAWERGEFSPVTHTLAQYFKMKPRWILIQAFGGGLDGLRAIAHASLVRRYLAHCGHWTSSYRLVLALLQDVDVEPRFAARDVIVNGANVDEVTRDALWDVVFARLACIQEYGWHAGIEDLTWITDSINGALSEFDWPQTQIALRQVRVLWTERIIDHAEENMVPTSGDPLPDDEP